jgi:hypothetical protein
MTMIPQKREGSKRAANKVDPNVWIIRNAMNPDNGGTEAYPAERWLPNEK